MKRLTVLLLTLLLFAWLPCAWADGAGWGAAYVNGLDADRVHLRSAPSTDAPSLGLYFTGAEVQCLSDPAQPWVQVTVGAEIGYMMSKYLSGEPPVSKQRLGTVGAGSVNFRQGPSLQAGLISTLPEGTTLTVHGETVDHWYYASAGGMAGYVMATYVTLGQTVSGVTGDSVGDPVTVRFDHADCFEAHVRAYNCYVNVYPTDDAVVSCTYDPDWVRLDASSARGASILFFESASGKSDLDSIHAADVYLPRAQFNRLYFTAEDGAGAVHGGFDSDLTVYGNRAQVDVYIATAFNRACDLHLTDSIATLTISEANQDYALTVTGIQDGHVDTALLHDAPVYTPGAAGYAYTVGSGAARFSVETLTRSTLFLSVMSTRWTDK